jgi:four helix bundle protein
MRTKNKKWNTKKEYKISKRAYVWSNNVIDLCEKLQETTLCRILFRQLVRSATSVAANIGEADAGLSKKDFRKCLGIALKECNESKVWLQYIIDRKLTDTSMAKEIQSEAIEISKILATIIINSKK